MSGQAKMSLRDDATWKDIGLTDYSDSLVVSLDFQTTSKKKLKRIFNPSPMWTGSCRIRKNKSLALGKLKIGLNKTKQDERLSFSDAGANRQWHTGENNREAIR